MARFRTSARSVDMLGRQQIAGIPTAVSEIFKNAYDAYATRVRGDFFPERRVLVIRDNGVGMTFDDFETRWLTVGTDSKARGGALPSIPRPIGLAKRRQMGEKGIGRLAIASLSPQLLVVTRAHSVLDSPEDHLTVALIQWSLFEAPGLTLEDVSVPVRRLSAQENVDRELVEEMRDEFLNDLAALGPRLTASHRQRIESELESLDLNVGRYLRLNGPQLAGASGTAFLLSAVYEDVDAAMRVSDSKKNPFSVSEFQRFLLGFVNTINPGLTTPDFDTEFLVHGPAGPSDVIDPASYFWEEQDFARTDHTIDGEFDELGTFRGQLSIYGREPTEVVEHWTGGAGDPTACGPFRVKFGYVQGQASDSRLTAEDFTSMTARLEKIGGLYVYRDGIRVLPYGNSDYDYLEIEQRRSLNAATYFFSYRRMFGAIEIDSVRNPDLQEKAGREGFRENRAYRDFRNLLKDFLVQLAASYFSARSEQSEDWRAERERLKQRAEASRARVRAEKQQRDRFNKEVYRLSEYIESGKLGLDAEAIVRAARDQVSRMVRNQDFADFESAEARTAHDLATLVRGLELTRPPDLPLSKDEARDFRSYERLRDFGREQVLQATQRIEVLFGDAAASSDEQVDSRSTYERRRARLAAAAQRESARLEKLGVEVRNRAAHVGGQIESAANESIARFSVEIDNLLRDANVVDFSSELEIVAAIRAVSETHLVVLNELIGNADAITDANAARAEMVALREEVLDLQEQVDGNLELLQLGQAVQIVSHEFEASIRSVRNGLKALTPWANSTPRLQPIVRDLRASFAHLDGYLRLFTPLQRRLYRESVVIHGDEIETFLRGVFSERLDRHHVELTATDAFKAWSFTGYPSTFYPAFVNLLDNAIHWVSAEAQPVRRLVTLDAR